MQIKSVLADIGHTYFISFLVVLLGVAFASIAGRLLGPEEFGVFQLGRRSATYFFPLIMIGLNISLVREISFTTGISRQLQIARVSAWIVLPGFLIAALIASFLSAPANELLFGLQPNIPSALGLFLLATLAFTYLYAQLRAFQQIKAANWQLMLTQGICPLIALALLSRKGFSGAELISSVSILMLISLTPGMIFFIRFLSSCPESDTRDSADFGHLLYRLLKYGAPRSIVPLLMGVVFTGGAIQLNNQGDANSAGLFLSMLFLLKIIEQSVGPISIVMLPNLSTMVGSGNNRQVLEYTQGLLGLLVPLGASLTIGFIVTSDVLIRLFYGESYLGGATTLKIISLTALPLLIITTLQGVLDALTSKGFVAISVFAGAAATLSLLFAFKELTLEQTTWIFVLSVWIIASLMIIALSYLIRFKIPVNELLKAILQAAIVGIAAYTAVWICKSAELPSWSILASAIVAGVAAFYFSSSRLEMMWLRAFNDLRQNRS